MQLTDKEIIKRIKRRIGISDFIFSQKHNRWYTYDEFWKGSACISEELKLLKVQKVIAIMENSIDLCQLYFACMLSNIQIIPIDPHKSQGEINKILAEHMEAKVIRDSDRIFCMDMEAQVFDEDMIREKIDGIDLRKVYMITYTSGSTGTAKGVIHNLRNLFLASESLGSSSGLDPSYTMCHVMPMTYMAGILNTIFMPFFCGCRIVIMPRFDVMSAVSFWKNAEKNNVNAFWLSPTMLNILMTVDRKGKARGYLSKTDTLFYVGTGPLYENVRKRFEERYGVSLLQSYGLSETLFLSSQLPGSAKDAESAGVILPGVKIAIQSDEEIGVDVPWMFLGYSNEKAEDNFQDGYYMTGDLGEIRDHELYITGRKKDLIIKGGMNISPRQIESCIMGIGMVDECAVAGVVRNEDEHIVCWYVSADGAGVSEKELNRVIGDRLGSYCKIDRFISVSEIPKNLNGKADKRRLTEEVQNDSEI